MLLPKPAKDEGVPYAPHWDGESILPNVTAIRLRAGELMIRDGKNIHRGHAQRTERLTLAGGWSGVYDPAAADTEPVESKVTDVRHYWQLDPAVREALPTDWMKTAYDRWKAKNHAGTDEQDISAGWVIETQKRLREQAEEEAA